MANPPNSRSQESKILWLLQAAWPNWTPAPELAKISLQYNRAIHSLRHRRHWQIDNRVRVVNGVRQGEFRLGAPAVPSSRELRQSQGKPDKPVAADRLFPDDAPLPHRDLG